MQARAGAFADLSIEFLQGLPDTPIARRLAGQYHDASAAVAANYRAARHTKSHADFTSKIGTVSEDADESVFWPRRMLNANIRSATVDINELLREAEELAGAAGATTAQNDHHQPNLNEPMNQ